MVIENKPPLVLVTGAGGYVGQELVRQLLARGTPVRAMVRDPSQVDALRQMGAEVVIADLQDETTLPNAVQGVSHVYHIASLFRAAGPPESVFHDINALGTRRMLDASIAAGVRRFVHCSTGGVLGNIENPPGDENTPYNPGDAYQRTKLEGEKIAMEYFRSGKIRGVVIRPAMIYGPGDRRNLKLFRMVSRRQFFFVGDGRTKVHFVDVRDLARAFILAMDKEHLNAEVYLVAGATAVSQKGIAGLIAQEAGVKPPWIHLPVKPMQWLGSACEAICRPIGIEPPIFRRRVDFFTKHREFNWAKARRELGYEPAQSLEMEIRELTRWYKENGWL
jgi:nucleoside-diphosphate-sugar epimerase